MLGQAGVSVDEVVGVARRRRHVVVTDEAVDALERSYAIATALISGEQAVYGLSTGFGALAERYIAPDQRAALQIGLVRSHAATVGDEIEPDAIRAMMLLRAATLAKGYSGIRPQLVHGLVGLLNAGHHAGRPRARLARLQRRSGSVGPRGPGPDRVKGRWSTGPAGRAEAADVLGAAGLAPIALEAKEGLALTNGTDGMLGHLCLACDDIGRLLRTAEVAAAMSVEALLGTDQAFRPELAALRPHPGQAASAANMLARPGRLRRRQPPTSATTPGSRTPTPCGAPRR